MEIENKTYSDTEIEEIVRQVEASKPWSGPVRSVELFVTKIYSKIAFTLIGLHVAFAGYISLPEKSLHWLIVMPFIALDLYFHFNPNRFDRMSVADWTRAFLRGEDFTKEKGYGYLKWTTLVYVPTVIITCLFIKSTLFHYSVMATYLGVMVYLYKKYSVFIWSIKKYTMLFGFNPHAGGALPYIVSILSVFCSAIWILSAPYDAYNEFNILSIVGFYILIPMYVIYFITLLNRQLKIYYLFSFLWEQRMIKNGEI